MGDICPSAVARCVIPLLSLFRIKQGERLSEEEGEFSSLIEFWLRPLNVEDMRMAAYQTTDQREHLHAVIPYTPLHLLISK